MQTHTKLSYLADNEFLAHLLDKEEPTAEDIESALRMELLLEGYSSLLEQIHSTAVEGLSEDHIEALERIRELTAPARDSRLPS